MYETLISTPWLEDCKYDCKVIVYTRWLNLGQGHLQIYITKTLKYSKIIPSDEATSTPANLVVYALRGQDLEDKLQNEVGNINHATVDIEKVRKTPKKGLKRKHEIKDISNNLKYMLF